MKNQIFFKSFLDLFIVLKSKKLDTENEWTAIFHGEGNSYKLVCHKLYFSCKLMYFMCHEIHQSTMLFHAVNEEKNKQCYDVMIVNPGLDS